MRTRATRTIRRLRDAEEWIATLLTIFLPAQIGKHVWPRFASIRGIRIDYLSPTLYLTDLLVIGAFGIFLMRKRLEGSRLPPASQVRFLLLLVGFAVMNTLTATSPSVTAIAWMRVTLLAALFVMIRSSRARLHATIRQALHIPIIWSSLVAIAQFIKQSSVGGMLYWLGERTFTSATPGISKAELFGRVLLRPYATFPHPNALAGFLVVAAALVLANGIPGAAWLRKVRVLSVWLAGLALAVTFSLSGWIAALALVVIFVKRRKAMRALAATCCGALLLVATQTEGQSVNQRLVLAQEALAMVVSHPILGVGLTGFIPSLVNGEGPTKLSSLPALYYQPVHNLYLLVATEVGVAAAITLIWLLVKSYRMAAKAHRQYAMAALLAIAFTGLVDHYWLTLQQNRLLAAIVMALIWRRLGG